MNDRIIRIKPKKAFWYYGLLLPMYFVWLKQVGSFVMRKNNRDSKYLKFLVNFLIALFLFIAFSAILFKQNKNEVPDWFNTIVPILFFATCFYCNWIVAKNMLDYEERDNECFFGLMTKQKEYLFRFFHLFYFPFSIYYLQQKVNQY